MALRKALWCAFHHGSILGNICFMGMVILPASVERLVLVPERTSGDSGAGTVGQRIPDHLQLTADREEFLLTGRRMYGCVSQRKTARADGWTDRT
ncbi:MAG: hypothetical protein ACLU6W_09990 [Lachnospiraceae bacterium]